MADILFDSTGDISVEGGRVTLTPTLQQNILQRLILSLRTNKGEWEFNTEFGTPWLKNQYNDLQLLGKTPKRIIDATVQQVILDTNGVLEILSYKSTVDKSTGQIVIDAEMSCAEGTIRLSSVAIG